MRKISLAIGFAAGYVLGAKAGTERYEEIVAKAREVAGMPAVQEATGTVKQTVSDAAESAKSTVNETVSRTSGGSGGTSGGSGDEVVDLTDVSATGYETGSTTPMAGARASDTV